MLRFIFFCLLAVLAFFCPCCLASFCVFSVSVVLTAAVTQASLQSMLHKILTAGPSAFNITTLLSQATQLSSQGTYTHRSICLVLPFTFKPAVFLFVLQCHPNYVLTHMVLRLALFCDLILNFITWAHGFDLFLAWGCDADSCQLWVSESASLS